MSDSPRDVARSRPAAWSSLIRADSSPGAQLNATCINRDRALGDTAMPAQTSGKGRVRDWFGPKARDVRRGGSPLQVNALHVGGPGVSVLIDACDPARYPGAGQAGTVGACLARAEIAPPGMTHVIITHGHHDHFCGLIALSVGTTFPEARHILSPLDWSDGSLTGEAQKADGSNADPAALEHLFRLGLLDLEEMTVPLPPEVTLIDSPGETPAHRVVRIASSGEVRYFLADLFHVMAEIDDPNLCLIWADAPALRASRSLIIATIRRERARFLCSHPPDVFSSSEFQKAS